MENTLAKFETKAKGLFEQKGGTIGMVVLAIGIVAVLIFSSQILGLIQAALTHLFGIIALVLVISGLLYVIFDKNARRIVGTLYMMGIRKIMGMVIKMNPIAILEDTIKKMYRSIENVEDKMGKLNGVRIKFKDKIKEKKRDLEECLQRKEVAKQKGRMEVVVVEDRQANRLVTLTQEYIDLQQSAENWYQTLSKLSDMAKLTAEDAENEVAAQKERYEMVKVSHSAFRSAMSILRGNPDDLAMFNQAFQFVNDDIMEKVGEMDRVINTTGGMLDKMDIEKEIFTIKGDDISKKYAELGIDALFEKMSELPSNKMKYMQAENMTAGPTPVLEKSKAKYFN
jgi:uncharacterized protein YjeT (DUF2065 family)